MYKLCRGGEIVADEREVDITIVPGIATLPPEAWGPTSNTWLQTLVEEAGSKAQVWVYSYNVLESSATVMQSICDEGADLLRALIDLPRTPKRVPILFISHSLGGLILKKALCIARQHHVKYREVIDVLAGIVFLGSPHISLDQDDQLNTLDYILRSRPKSRVKIRLDKSDRVDFNNLCQQFEGAKIKVPILSTYETKVTKLNNNLLGFWKIQSQLIIGQKDCQVKGEKESFLGIAATHDEICLTKEGDPLYAKVRDILTEIIREAPPAIEERFRPYAGPAGSKQLTLRSKSPPAKSSTRRVAQEQAASQTIPSAGKLSTPRKNNAEVNVGSSDRSLEHGSLTAPFEGGRKDPILPCYSIKNLERNVKFLGRDHEMKLLDQALLPMSISHNDEETGANQCLRSFGICGMGGLDKTQIAKEYIFSRLNRYDAVFWIASEDKNALEEGFAALATQLGLEDESENHDLIVNRERVKEWLSNPLKSSVTLHSPENEASWLLVFDNADDLSVLNDCWPLTGRGSVLITSRDPVAKTNFYTENRGIDLNKLTLPETISCVKSLTRSTVDTDEGQSIRIIAEILDGHFLGIEQMSSIIRRLRVSYADFLDLYQTQSNEIHGILPEDNLKQYQHSLETVWSLQQLSKGTNALLETLAMLDPDSVPETLLTKSLDQAKMEEYPKDMIAYYECRGELIGASLVSLVDQTEPEKKLQLHRLLQDVVLSKMTRHRQVEVFDAALRLVSFSWPFQNLLHRHQRERWKQCGQIYTHVARLKRFGQGISLAKQKTVDEVQFAALMNDAGWYLFERGLIPEALEYFALVQRICDESPQRETRGMQDILRDCHNNQGTLANEANNAPGALYHYRIWMDLSLQRRAQVDRLVEDYELGCVYHELGVAYAFNEDWTVAIEHFMRCWNIWEKLEEFKETMLLWPVSNLGYIYCEIDRLTEAEDMLLRYLKIQSDECGIDDTQSFRTGKLLHALGNVYQKMAKVDKSKADESLQYHIRTLNQYRATLGDSHTRTAAACHKLAGHYIKKKQFSAANKMLQQALKVFGARPYLKNELARTTYKQSQYFEAQGDKVKAMERRKKAFEIRSLILTNDHQPLHAVKEADYDRLIIFWNR